MSTNITITRVRIAVCVDADGYYCAGGWSNVEGVEDIIEPVVFAEDNLVGTDSSAPQHIVWVEADVPLPTREDLVVEGEVA